MMGNLADEVPPRKVQVIPLEPKAAGRRHPLTPWHQSTCRKCLARNKPTPRPRPPEPGARRPVGPPDFILKFDGELDEKGMELMRQFTSGATRDTADGKLPYGFDSPLVDRRYAEYMQEHRLQSDGKLRDPDNWQHGMSRDVYMDSLHRHYQDLRLLWAMTRRQNGVDVSAHEEKLSSPDVDIETVLCALLFNVKGMLFEVLNGR